MSVNTYITTAVPIGGNNEADETEVISQTLNRSLSFCEEIATRISNQQEYDSDKFMDYFSTSTSNQLNVLILITSFL
jgi:hypothetical protein